MFVFPTRDVHLLSAAGLTDEIHLSLYINAGTPSVWRDLASLANVINAGPAQPPAHAVVRGRTGGANDSPTGLSFKPGTNGFGTDFFISNGAAGARFVVRVTTHTDILQLFVAQPKVTMLAGENNVVLTVFGRFDDPGGPTVWDISEHPYLQFSSATPAVADVEATTGRITAKTAGTAVVSVQVRGRPTTAQSCTVTVDTVAARRARGDIQITVLQRPRGATRSALIFSEGYSDGAVFMAQAQQIVDTWMRAEANSPFRWVRDQFTITAVFDKAPDRGIAFGPPGAALAGGTLIPQMPAPIANVLGVMKYAPARDTRFGLIYGARIGDPQASDPAVGITPAVAPETWRAPMRPDRAIIVDHRKLSPYRLPPPSAGQLPVAVDPRDAFRQFLDRYVAALALARDDKTLVVFLVDDQFRGGARLAIAGVEREPNPMVAVATIGDTQGMDNWHTAAGSPILIRSPRRRTFHAGWVTSTLVHEIGHSFGLGDEYETYRQEMLSAAPTPAQVDAARPQLDRYDNLELREDVFNGTAIDPARIKWFVRRVAKASRVDGLAVAGGNFAATVGADPRTIWSAGEEAVLRTTYTRRRPAGAKAPPRRPWSSGCRPRSPSASSAPAASSTCRSRRPTASTRSSPSPSSSS
jgi:hypothetical protein